VPIEGVSWAVVQRGILDEFILSEHEEDEIWQEQLDLGSATDADLQRVVQCHWQEAYNVNQVGALSVPTRFLLCS